MHDRKVKINNLINFVKEEQILNRNSRIDLLLMKFEFTNLHEEFKQRAYGNRRPVQLVRHAL